MSAKKATAPQSKAAANEPAAAAPAASAGGRRDPVRSAGDLRPRWWLLAFLVLTTLALYRPAWHGGVLWDDDKHLTSRELQSAEGLRRIWFELGAVPQYYPVVHTSFWVLHALWGDDTFGYHVVNIVLHALSAFLVALILWRLVVPGALMAAVLFAWHPVHVESVAWITELKNTLSGVLYLGAALAYLHFDSGRGKRAYALALALFVLALLSKTVTATLPAALLVVFWWQRGRLDWRKDVAPLAPFFVLGVAGGLLTAWVEHEFIRAQGAEYAFTPIERGLIAGRVLWFYLGKLFWPADLIFIYPRWEVSQGAAWQYVYPVAFLVLLAALWALRKRTRAPLAALLFFAGTLFPALGFFNVYPFRYSLVADHFQYLASIGIIALVSALAALALRRWSASAAALFAACLAVGAPLAARTWRQSAEYADVRTLYRATLERNPECWLVHNNLGALSLNGSPDELRTAIAHFEQSLKWNPQNASAHNNLGSAMQRLGRLDEALARHQEAVRLDPNSFEAANNLGAVLLLLQRPEEAVTAFNAALRGHPRSGQAHFNLGLALQALGRNEEALAHLERALALYQEPPLQALDAAKAAGSAGAVLVMLGRREAALERFQEALRLQPNYLNARLRLGSLFLDLGRFEEALAQLQRALEIDPNLPDAHNGMGLALARLGRRDEAAAHFNEALRLAPDFAEARANLARLTAGQGG